MYTRIKLLFLTFMTVIVAFHISFAQETASASEPQASEQKKIETVEPEKSEPPSSEEKAKAPEQKENVPPSPAESKGEETKKTPETKPDAGMSGCVAPLKGLVAVYEKEIVSVKKMMDRWNGMVSSSLKRQSALESEIEGLEKELASQKEAKETKNKKEISRLEKQLERLRKEEKSLKKEIQKQCQELSSELSEFSKGSQSVIKEKFQQVQQDVEGTLKE